MLDGLNAAAKQDKPKIKQVAKEAVAPKKELV